MTKKGLPVKHIFDIKKRVTFKKRRQVSGNHSLNLPSYTQVLAKCQDFDITSALTDINLIDRETLPMKKVCPKNNLKECQKKANKALVWRISRLLNVTLLASYFTKIMKSTSNRRITP